MYQNGKVGDWNLVVAEDIHDGKLTSTWHQMNYDDSSAPIVENSWKLECPLVIFSVDGDEPVLIIVDNYFKPVVRLLGELKMMDEGVFEIAGIEWFDTKTLTSSHLRGQLEPLLNGIEGWTVCVDEPRDKRLVISNPEGTTSIEVWGF